LRNLCSQTLTQRLTDEITNKRQEIKHEQFQKLEEEKRTASMVQACELASSILNMSKTDIDELLDVDMYQVLWSV
jgi:peroxiredoxin family protein